MPVTENSCIFNIPITFTPVFSTYDIIKSTEPYNIQLCLQNIKFTISVHSDGSNTSVFKGIYIKIIQNSADRFLCNLDIINFKDKKSNITAKYDLSKRDTFIIITTMTASTITSDFVRDNKLFIRVRNFKLENHPNFNTPRPHNPVRELFENPLFTDIVLQVEDKEIKANKCILSNYSEVFRTMLQDPNIDGIRLHDTKYFTMLEAIKFIYTGTYDKSLLQPMPETIESTDSTEPNSAFSNAELFIEMCKTYKLDDMLEEIKKDITENVDDNNVFDYCRLAEKHKMWDLLEKSMSYISANQLDYPDSEKDTLLYTMVTRFSLYKKVDSKEAHMGSSIKYF